MSSIEGDDDPPVEGDDDAPVEGDDDAPVDGDGGALLEMGNGAPIEGTREITGFITYTGAGFAVVRPAAEIGAHPNPTPVTNRRYLRGGLPEIYQEQDFAMRFVGALEGVLDPIVALLDTLPAHFDPELAPLDLLDLATKWLGLEHNEAQPASQLRNLVRHTAELGRLRGTRAGVEMALALNFPELPLRVEDGGGVVISASGEPPKPSPPAFVVYCDTPISQEEAAEVARVIEAVKPVHVGFRLRIKGRRRETAA
jgi:phage tail-like protein